MREHRLTNVAFHDDGSFTGHSGQLRVRVESGLWEGRVSLRMRVDSAGASLAKLSVLPRRGRPEEAAATLIADAEEGRLPFPAGEAGGVSLVEPERERKIE
jgi:hypothetical protein